LPDCAVRGWVQNDSVSIKLVPFQLRLPEGLHRELKVEAARNRRSLQAEILQRLDESFVEPALPLDHGLDPPVGPWSDDVLLPGVEFKGPDPRPGKKRS